MNRLAYLKTSRSVRGTEGLPPGPCQSMTECRQSYTDTERTLRELDAWFLKVGDCYFGPVHSRRSSQNDSTEMISACRSAYSLLKT